MQSTYGNQPTPDGRPANRQWRWARLCWVIAAASIATALVPMFGLVDIYDGGGAMIFVGLWLAVSSSLVGMLLRSRARAHDRITGAKIPTSPGEGEHLAHWFYDQAAWLEHTTRDSVIERAHKWALWRVVAAFCVGIGGIFLIADPEGGGLAVAVVLLATMVLIAAVIHFGTATQVRRNRTGAAEVFIGTEGIWYHGVLHVWRGWGGRLDKVRYPDSSGNLQVVYSLPARYGRQYQEVRVMVPAGHESEAQMVAAKLRSASR